MGNKGESEDGSLIIASIARNESVFENCGNYARRYWHMAKQRTYSHLKYMQTRYPGTSKHNQASFPMSRRPDARYACYKDVFVSKIHRAVIRTSSIILCSFCELQKAWIFSKSVPPCQKTEQGYALYVYIRKGSCFLLNAIIIDMDISFSFNFLLIFEVQIEGIFDRVNLFVGKICVMQSEGLFF